MVDNLASGLTAVSGPYGEYTYTNHGPNSNTEPLFYYASWSDYNKKQQLSALHIPEPTSFYEVMQDPRYPNDPSKKIPRFRCDCPNGTSTLDGDPLVCHQDICLNGGNFGSPDASPVAFFDQNKQQCICGAGRMIKTNVNGACYPVSEDNCVPHKESGICTYGWSIILPARTPIISGTTTLTTPQVDVPLMFVANVKQTANGFVLTKTPGYAMSGDTVPRYLCATTYTVNGNTQQCFVIMGNMFGCTACGPDDQGIPPFGGKAYGPTDKYYNFLATDSAHLIPRNVLNWLYGTLLAFPIKRRSDPGVVMPVITADTIPTTIDLINSLASNPKGVGFLCNSFFSKRGDDFPKCKDPLSKSGSEFIGLCEDPNNNICTPTGTCFIDLSKNSGTEGKGYTCECKSGFTFNGVNCGGCVKAGNMIYFDNSANHVILDGNLTRMSSNPGDLSNGDQYKEERCCSGKAEIIQFSGGMAKCK
jgi:hypothetical protein